jgi:hypothetical protein
MDGAEAHVGALCRAYNNYDETIQRMLSKVLNKNDYTLASSEATSTLINLIHDINLIMNGNFPTDKYSLEKPVKHSRELLNLSRAKFKDNKIYDRILDIIYADKVDGCFTRGKTHNPEKQKIQFLEQRNFELLKRIDDKTKALTQKIDPLTQTTPASLLGPISQLIGMNTIIKDAVKSFEIFFKIPDRWENYPCVPAERLNDNIRIIMKTISEITTQEEVSAIPEGIRELINWKVKYTNFLHQTLKDTS